jgi:hypothetical protein
LCGRQWASQPCTFGRPPRVVFAPAAFMPAASTQLPSARRRASRLAPPPAPQSPSPLHRPRLQPSSSLFALSCRCSLDLQRPR